MSQIGFNRNNTSADVGADIMAAVLKGLIPTSGIVEVFDDLACVRVNDKLVRLSSGFSRPVVCLRHCGTEQGRAGSRCFGEQDVGSECD